MSLNTDKEVQFISLETEDNRQEDKTDEKTTLTRVHILFGNEKRKEIINCFQ